MNSIELRNKFLKYFEDKGHKIIPSASLVPKEQDITESDMTLFTTAGMQQFKRFYVNPEEAPYARAASSQKCIRTGDIDEVGDDTHLSFFEMLGNFSFGYPNKEGSYFKKEAIEYAWEFLTEVLKDDQGKTINKRRIHATYYGEKGVALAPDLVSKNLLSKYLPEDKIKEGNRLDNFWSLGSEGSPGGPTVEFYIDGIEVWNLVFNEYVMHGGKYEPAEFKGVDTGMGLERLFTTLNGHNNVYETDLFEDLINRIHNLSHREYKDNLKGFRIIADHIKASVFAISDGVLPSNKGAGYVVRRLIRRAIVKAHQLGIKENFTIQLAGLVFDIYKDTYFYAVILAPSVIPAKAGIQDLPHGSLGTTSSHIAGPEDDKGGNAQNDIKKELEKEENKFRATLKEGLKIIGEQKEATGKIIFDLYQSFGLPSEISIEEFKRRNIEVSNETIKQYNNLMRKHQELSRTASAGMFKGGLADAGEIAVKYHTATHLLHQVLRQVLGEHVQQKGSNITAERLRFDFVHTDKMTPKQIADVENMVNEQINKDLPVTMEEMTVEEAKNSGALGFFEHKYGDKVKVYTIGSNDKYFSREICGGPHVGHTSELGKFKIKKEESSSAGIRRIKAVLE